MYRLRGFQARDLPRLHQLDKICFPPEIAYSKRELQYFLTHPRCSCWVAEKVAEPPDSLLAGFIILERASRNTRPVGHVVTLDVDAAERRRGLGALLMHTAEEQMKQEGIAWMSLEVGEDNAVARRFYRSLGFVTRGRIAKYYGGKVDAEVMEKELEFPGPF